MRVLLIEDDRETAAEIKDEIEKHYIVDVAYSGVDGSYMSQVNNYDAIVVDMELPDMSGIEVCRVTRAANIHTPIIMLSSSHEITPRVSSLDSGADDCLTTPFSFSELLARLRALMRRHSMVFSNSKLYAGDLQLDVLSKTVIRGDTEIYLRRKEFDLLEYLVRNKNRIVSKEMILDHVWEQGIEVGSNTVEVHIRCLRDKIDRMYEKKLIKTVHNFGYKIDCKS